MKSMEPKTPEEDQAAMVKMFEHMATYGGGPSRPVQMQYGTAENGAPAVWFSVGLTKREEFASRFMAALISNGEVPPNHLEAANVAIAYADALLERLKK